MEKGDVVFIRATYAPMNSCHEGSMLRVVTADEGTVVYVSPAELIVPDKCDGNRGERPDV